MQNKKIEFIEYSLYPWYINIIKFIQLNMEKQSILDNVNLNEIADFVKNEDILVAQFESYDQFRGLYEYSKLGSPYKMLLFCDENLGPRAFWKLRSFDYVIICKYSKSSNLYKYIPIIKSELEFNHAFICNISRSRFSWMNILRVFEKTIKSRSNNNMYILPLAGELSNPNLELESEYNLETWHRIEEHNIIIKRGEEFPEHILEGAFLHGNEKRLLLSMMQYIQDNSIVFDYQVSMFGNRIPIYYWLEVVKPSEEKKTEFLSRMGSHDKTVEEYISKFDHYKRREFYSLLKRNISNLTFFEDPRLIGCIKRIFTYLKNDNDIVYSKRW